MQAMASAPGVTPGADHPLLTRIDGLLADSDAMRADLLAARVDAVPRRIECRRIDGADQ